MGSLKERWGGLVEGEGLFGGGGGGLTRGFAVYRVLLFLKFSQSIISQWEPRLITFTYDTYDFFLV